MREMLRCSCGGEPEKYRSYSTVFDRGEVYVKCPKCGRYAYSSFSTYEQDKDYENEWKKIERTTVNKWNNLNKKVEELGWLDE